MMDYQSCTKIQRNLFTDRGRGKVLVLSDKWSSGEITEKIKTYSQHSRAMEGMKDVMFCMRGYVCHFKNQATNVY